MEKDIFKRIKKLRKKLNVSIKKNGLKAEETKQISHEINTTINEYYTSIKITRYPENSKMKKFYEQSYIALKQLTSEQKKFPTTQEWNAHAKQRGYAMHITLEYMSQLEWNYLQIRVERELKMEKFF